ncbi:MAG: TlpA disulfide reductase family protein [Flavobacteriaceae bacterium]
MKFTKKMWSNILFFGFIIFLFTPYGASTKAKLIQGVTYVKTLIFAPSADEVINRKVISSLDLSLKGISYANDVNLASQKGKVIFINYWATWCPPCRAEMPSIQSLFNDYKDKVSFIFITSDDKSKVDKYYSENKYKLPTYNMLSNPASEINTRSLPTTFIIDKQGRLALKETGASNWNSGKVRKMLDDLINE